MDLSVIQKLYKGYAGVGKFELNKGVSPLGAILTHYSFAVSVQVRRTLEQATF